MTSLLEGAKKLVSRSTDIGARIEGLDAAIVASRGRLPDALLDDSQTVLERASSRLWLSADHTVVALARASRSRFRVSSPKTRTRNTKIDNTILVRRYIAHPPYGNPGPNRAP